MGSLDSSDTYATCNTHPFPSEGDLTSEGCKPGVDKSCLYINPLNGASGDRMSNETPLGPAVKTEGPNPEENVAATRASMTQEPLGRNKLFQGSKLRPRIGETPQLERKGGFQLSEAKFGKTATVGGITSASRLINCHLFGLPGLGGSKRGKGSVKSPENSEKKSILKKSDSLHKPPDPELEKLISDTNASVSDTNSEKSVPCADTPVHKPSVKSNVPISANRLPLKAIGPKKGTKPQALPIKFVGIDETAKDKSKGVGPHHRLRSPLPRVDLGDAFIADFRLAEGHRMVDLPNCKDPKCRLNRLAQNSPQGPVCLCGLLMEQPLVPLIKPLIDTSTPKHAQNSHKAPLVAEEEDLLFADTTPSEETLLLEQGVTGTAHSPQDDS